jgi:3-oxoacyl-[acyl-carrier protein] reductase
MLVTGGSRGIGREIVLGAALRGAQVAFCGREIGREAQDFIQEVEHMHAAGQVIAVQADVSKESDVANLFETVLEAFGKIDIVVNNAGISIGYLLVSTPPETWDEVIGTNLTGAFLVSREAIKEFQRLGKGGRIISVGSVTQNGAPTNASYAASKGGLVGLTRAIAREYGGRGVLAFLVVGGYTDTDLMTQAPDLRDRVIKLNPQKRLATPDEIASVVLFLASNRAVGIVNGAELYASGGLTDPPVKWVE